MNHGAELVTSDTDVTWVVGGRVWFLTVELSYHKVVISL
jgi:hypothetical protein